MLKRAPFLFAVCCLLAWCTACTSPAPETPLNEFPQVPATASYDIQVRLDPAEKMLHGSETITYVNRSQQAISDLVFHLYLNAFRSQDSIFLRESGTEHRGFAWQAQYPGWIKVTGISLLDGAQLDFEEIEDGTLGRVDLPAAVPPGGQVQVRVDFQALLPRVFARTGFAADAQGDDFFMVGQWFPKLGVWEDGAWNAYPFHVNSEFYADFGVYDVAITLPDGYVLGASGVPLGAQGNADGTQTTRYHAEGVIDFAWTASPNFRQASRRVEDVELVYVYLPEHDWTVERVLDASEASLRSFGAWFGSYPYPRLTVVDVPEEGGGAGGMEYPTLITAGAESFLGAGPLPGLLGAELTLEVVTIHEAGHQWWQSMAAFNEAEEPWLDEGFTDYSAMRLANQLYGEGRSMLDAGSWEVGYLDTRRAEYLMRPNVPMYGRAWEFSGMMDYGVAAYSKPALSLLTLENILGEETMLKVMHTFFDGCQFQHCHTEDFRQVAEEISGQDLSWFFDGLVYGSATVDYRVASLADGEVVVQREGGLALPVELEVRFADGETLTEQWDGAQAEKVFAYPERPAVVEARLDPQGKLLVDLDWSNNGLRQRADLWSWAALTTRLVYQLQNALLALGGF